MAIDEKELKPGRELDALIAEKVMGWKRSTHQGVRADFATYEYERWTIGIGKECDEVPPYSTDIAAAWEVVGKLPGFCLESTGDNRWAVNLICLPDRDGEIDVIADTAPHAICLAALKATSFS